MMVKTVYAAPDDSKTTMETMINNVRRLISTRDSVPHPIRGFGSFPEIEPQQHDIDPAIASPIFHGVVGH